MLRSSSFLSQFFSASKMKFVHQEIDRRRLWKVLDLFAFKSWFWFGLLEIHKNNVQAEIFLTKNSIFPPMLLAPSTSDRHQWGRNYTFYAFKKFLCPNPCRQHQAVSHLTTIRAQCCLSVVIKWQQVFPAWHSFKAKMTQIILAVELHQNLKGR